MSHVVARPASAKSKKITVQDAPRALAWPNPGRLLLQQQDRLPRLCLYPCGLWSWIPFEVSPSPPWDSAQWDGGGRECAVPATCRLGSGYTRTFNPRSRPHPPRGASPIFADADSCKLCHGKGRKPSALCRAGQLTPPKLATMFKMFYFFSALKIFTDRNSPHFAPTHPRDEGNEKRLLDHCPKPLRAWFGRECVHVQVYTPGRLHLVSLVFF